MPGTWRLGSSPVLSPWFSSACLASPSLSQSSDHLPFPPSSAKGPGCECWRVRVSLGAFEALHASILIPKGLWHERVNRNHHDGPREVPLRKKEKKKKLVYCFLNQSLTILFFIGFCTWWNHAFYKGCKYKGPQSSCRLTWMSQVKLMDTGAN